MTELKAHLIAFKNRTPGGSAQISEFAVALFFLFACVVLPLINLCVVPIRWSLGKTIVSTRVHQLAQAETLGQAFKADQGDTNTPSRSQVPARETSPGSSAVISAESLPSSYQGSKQVSGQGSPQESSHDMGQESVQDKLNKIAGLTVKASQLALIVESAKLQGQTKTITRVGTVNQDWLPDGPLGPYVYRLDLTVDSDIAPLIVIPVQNPRIPGLTAPFAVQFHDSSVWENTGRDPVSGEFYLNE